jgi:hypothetical protein
MSKSANISSAKVWGTVGHARKILMALMQIIIQLDDVGIASILRGNRHSGINHMNPIYKLGIWIVCD